MIAMGEKELAEPSYVVGEVRSRNGGSRSGLFLPRGRKYIARITRMLFSFGQLMHPLWVAFQSWKK